MFQNPGPIAMPLALARAAATSRVAASIGVFVYACNFIASFWLPEPAGQAA